jgi:hypothetical protein
METYLEEGGVDPFVLREYGAKVGTAIKSIFEKVRDNPATEIILSIQRSDICPNMKECPLYPRYQCDCRSSVLQDIWTASNLGWVIDGRARPASQYINFPLPTSASKARG